MKRGSTQARTLRIGPEKGTFIAEKAADLDYRMGQAMASFNGDKCFVIGGSGKDDRPLYKVSYYMFANDEWDHTSPDLTVARTFAAACSLGENLFVFGGFDG